MDTWEAIKQLIATNQLKKSHLAKELGISRTTLDSWLKEVTSPDHKEVQKMSKILDRFAGLSRPAGKQVNLSVDHAIPFYDAVAVGGLAVYQADQAPVVQPSETVDPGTWFRSATAAMRVYGDSMYPKYKSGCIIALKEIHDKEEIIYGEDYVVETTEQRVLKRLMRSEKGEEYIEMNSINPQQDSRGRQIYAPKDFHLSKIRRIYKVLGQILYESGGDNIVHR